MISTILTTVDIPGVDSEELAARDLGGGHFVVESIPFVDTSLALGDIVACVSVAGRNHVDRVVVHGGNSTLRVLPSFIDVASPLVQLGCRVEEGPAGLLAVSIPPDGPGEGVQAWLEDLREQNLIELA